MDCKSLSGFYWIYESEVEAEYDDEGVLMMREFWIRCWILLNIWWRDIEEEYESEVEEQRVEKEEREGEFWFFFLGFC